MLRWSRVSWVTALSVLLMAAGACREAKSTRWDEKAAEVKEGKVAPVDKSTVEKGASLNSFFPPEDHGLRRTFTQEKLGYAEAKLVREGKTAQASISDTNNNPNARAKFDGASDRVKGHPLVTVGKRQSALLVNGRWQVKVSSSDFDAAERKALLEAFDLAQLSSF